MLFRVHPQMDRGSISTAWKRGSLLNARAEHTLLTGILQSFTLHSCLFMHHQEDNHWDTEAPFAKKWKKKENSTSAGIMMLAISQVQMFSFWTSKILLPKVGTCWTERSPGRRFRPQVLKLKLHRFFRTQRRHLKMCRVYTRRLCVRTLVILVFNIRIT